MVIVNSILPFEAILPSPFMCVNIVIIITILAVTWHMYSAAALESNGYGLESSLAGHLDKGSVYLRGGPVSKCTE